MHIFISHVLIPSKAMLARLFCLSSANFLRSLCWALHSVQPPTKDDISSLLNRQRAHCTLCRVVIKKASGGKKSQWWFSLMAVVRAIQRYEDVIVVLIDMCVHPGWLPGCINCMAGKGGPATWWWWKQAASGPASRGRGSLLLLHGSPTGTPAPAAQGLKDTRSEGPLIGLPTSTDLLPEGRSSTHAPHRRNAGLQMSFPCLPSHVPTMLFVILRPIPFGDNWFHVAAAASAWGHMWTGKATSRCHQVTITAPCTLSRPLYNSNTQLLALLIGLERIERVLLEHKCQNCANQHVATWPCNGEADCRWRKPL